MGVDQPPEGPLRVISLRLPRRDRLCVAFRSGPALRAELWEHGGIIAIIVLAAPIPFYLLGALGGRYRGLVLPTAGLVLAAVLGLLLAVATYGVAIGPVSEFTSLTLAPAPARTERPAPSRLGWVALIVAMASLGSSHVAAQSNALRSRRLAAEAQAALPTDPAAGLRLAARAYGTWPTPEARRVFRQAALVPPSRAVLRHDSAYRVTFSPDGRRLASVGLGRVVVWEWAVPGAGPIVLEHPVHVSEAHFSPDGRRVVTAGTHDRTRDIDSARIWDLGTGGDPLELQSYLGRAPFASFSPDGTKVLTAGHDGVIRVWDWAAGEAVVIRRQATGVTDAQFSPDGRRVLTAGHDGSVRVWDWEQGGEPVTLYGHVGPVWAAAFSADGRRVVTGGEDGAVRVWDWAEMSVLHMLQPPRKSVWRRPFSPSAVWEASFSPDGRHVLSVDRSGSAALWDLTTRHKPILLRPHQGAVLDAVFSPDGRQIVTAGEDTVRVWDCSACSWDPALAALAGTLSADPLIHSASGP